MAFDCWPRLGGHGAEGRIERAAAARQAFCPSTLMTVSTTTHSMLPSRAKNCQRCVLSLAWARRSRSSASASFAACDLFELFALGLRVALQAAAPGGCESRLPASSGSRVLVERLALPKFERLLAIEMVLQLPREDRVALVARQLGRQIGELAAVVGLVFGDERLPSRRTRLARCRRAACRGSTAARSNRATRRCRRPYGRNALCLCPTGPADIPTGSRPARGR